MKQGKGQAVALPNQQFRIQNVTPYGRNRDNSRNFGKTPGITRLLYLFVVDKQLPVWAEKEDLCSSKILTAGKTAWRINMKMLFIKKERFFLFGLSLVLAAWIFSGCTTSVPVTYTEPARLNMSGVKRIAIDSDPDVAGRLSSRLTAKYTVASAAELQAWKDWRVNAAFQAPAVEVRNCNKITCYFMEGSMA